jgi:hypothetical protein
MNMKKPGGCTPHLCPDCGEWIKARKDYWRVKTWLLREKETMEEERKKMTAAPAADDDSSNIPLSRLRHELQTHMRDLDRTLTTGTAKEQLVILNSMMYILNKLRENAERAALEEETQEGKEGII